MTNIVVADTSLVLNFLRLDRMALLGAWRFDVLATDHVSQEITDPVHRARYAKAEASGHIREEAVTDLAEVAIFLKLATNSRLGPGERSAIAVALNRGYPLAIDDNRALKRAVAEAGITRQRLVIYRTQDIVLDLIKSGALDVGVANAMKAAWERQHRFKLKFGSFADLL
ncbi:hypothetical protein [Neoroseomonas marina]|uniref:hypothetical protein n=1 Tax=Neoroseomonas marina TaxID=1232220 RepID=UPI001B7D69E2|nr:hypothetical protein [Neoroseomonas marina]